MKKNGFIQKITIKFYSPHGIIYKCSEWFKS
jgi:hypothetical protein